MSPRTERQRPSAAPEAPDAEPAREEATTEGQPSFFQETWNQLGAVKLAITLLVLWAAFSVIGTLVPQEWKYSSVDISTKQFGTFWGPLIAKLRFYNVYQSLWYRALLILLSLNIFVCTVDRTRTALRRVRRPRVRTSVPAVMGMRASAQSNAKASSAELVETMRASLRKRGYSVAREPHERGVDILGRRGAVKVLGPMIVHISILLVFIGAIVGRSGLMGNYKDFARIPVGGVHHEQRSDQYVELTAFDVPFRLEADGHSFGMTMPLDYTSDVTVYDPVPAGMGDRDVWLYRPVSIHSMESDIVEPAETEQAPAIPNMTAERVGLRERRKASIRVNHPLVSKKVGLYQQTWGLVTDVVATDASGKETKTTWMLEAGVSPLRSAFGTATMADGKQIGFSLDIAQGGDNAATPTDNRVPMGPSLILVTMDGSKQHGSPIEMDEWLTPSHPVKYGDITFSIGEVTAYTGLDFKKDPGVWLVMVGFSVGALGLILGFYVPHRQVRVKITELKEGGSRVVIGADAGRDNVEEARKVVEGLRSDAGLK